MNYEIEPEKMVMPKPDTHPPQGWVGTWTTPAPYLYLVISPSSSLTDSSCN